MSKSRKEGPPSPRTTIVGGRPPENGQGLPPVPVGLQSLLRYASVDSDFRRELVERRAEVAEAAAIVLTASERAILGAVPERQLEEMIANIPPPSSARRDFLRRSAASAVVLLGGAAFAGSMTAACDGEDPPTPPPSGEDLPRPEVRTAPAGIAPEVPVEPPERPDHREMETEGGAAPDEPEAPTRPDPPAEPPPPRPEPRPTRGIRPDIPRSPWDDDER